MSSTSTKSRATSPKLILTPEELAAISAEIRDNAPELILVNDIEVDEAYQRPLAPAHPINKSKPSATLFSAIHVSLRNGRYWVWEGQHRVLRAKEVGIPHLWAFVDTATQRQQARNFADMQKGRKGLKPWETHKASIVAREPLALAVAEALAVGCSRVIGANGNVNIKAVQAVYDVYGSYGAETLTDTAALIEEIWPESNGAWVGDMWAGVGLLLHENGITERQMSNLGRVLPDLIVQQAKAERAKFTRAGTTGGPAKGNGPFVRDVLLEIARKRKKK